jgi:hypothetical protein
MNREIIVIGSAAFVALDATLAVAEIPGCPMRLTTDAQ